MKLPPSGTKRHKAMMVLYKHGEMMLSGVFERMANESRDAVGNALKSLVAQDLAVRNGFIYDLAKPVRDYLDGCETVKDSFVPQVATPRQSYAWTPEMKGYEAMLFRNRR